MKRMLSALALLLVGCGGDAAPPAKLAPPPERQVTWAVDRAVGVGGPVEFVLRVEATALDLGQDLVVEEELRIDAGFVAEFPDVLPEDLEGLGLARIHDLPDEQRGTSLVRRRRLHLEPERVGACAIAERWAFFRRSTQDVAEEKTLTTPRIDLTVEALPANLELALPPTPTIYTEDPEPPPASQWSWLLLAAPLLLLPLIFRRKVAPPPPPAHEVAYDALARLDALELLKNGDVDAYFVYVSAILREYAERRFGVRAPERTTQEFLAEATVAPALAAHRSLLDDFLRLADAVKFARERPADDEARAARDTVRTFIDATRTGATPALVGGAA